MSPLDIVLSRLDRPRQSGASQWTARCPAHDDRNPSLGISIGNDGRVLLLCHARCELDAICEALGLTVRDLFPDGPPPTSAMPAPRSTPFATADDATRAVTARVRRERGPDWNLQQTHVYTDAAGREVMRVLRFQSGDDHTKTFRPIGRVGDGWRIGDPEGPLPLYRLPTLTAAETVYVIEGEKAADAAIALGLTATTAAHGARSASKSNWYPLAGKDIVVFPDNDEAGRGYADEVAAILVQLDPPARVRIVGLPDLPVHGDIVEFIAARRARGIDDTAVRGEVVQLAERAAPIVSSGSASMEASGGAEPTFGQSEPLPDALPAVDPFDMELLPEALRPWIEDIARRIQCPPDFPAVSAMVTLAAVVGRKIGIRPKQYDDWLVVPNLWGALIGRPGVMKTPPLQEGTRPLKRLEIEAKKEYDEKRALHAAHLLVFEAKKKAIQRDVRSNLDANNDAAALEAARQALASGPQPPVRQRKIVNDSTVEKLGEILNENANGVLVLRDELIGWLKSLDKEGQEAARAFFLEAWNGTGRYTYDRIGRGTLDIEAAIVSVLGSIQPGPLGSYMRGAIAGGRDDDGLVSRFQLLVWPDASRAWENVDTWPSSAAKSRAYGVFERLDKITAEAVGATREQNDDGIPFLRFTPEAQVVFDRWRGGLERRLRAEEEHPALESHFAKYRSLIPSLALLIHLADVGTGLVGSTPLRKALAWGRYLSSHARRVYSTATAADVAAARRLVSRIMRGDIKDGFTEREVYRHQWSGLGQEDVKLAVSVLVEYGWIVSQPVKGPLGRPSAVHWINPRVLNGGPRGTDNTDETSASPEAEHARTAHELGERTDKTDETGQEEPSGSFGSALDGQAPDSEEELEERASNLEFDARLSVVEAEPQADLFPAAGLQDPEASASVGGP